MGTLGILLIGLIAGTVIGTFGLAIFVNRGGRVTDHALDVKEYCHGRASADCKFHIDDMPYCGVSYPFAWKIKEEEDEEE